MWMVGGRPIKLTYAHGKLFKAGASALAHRIVAEDHFCTGSPPFDTWPAHKRLSFMATATRGLLGRSRPDAFPSLWTDASVAAVMKYVELAVESRTYFGPDLAVPWPGLVRRAHAQCRRSTHYWDPPKVLPCHAVRQLRSLWTNLEWEWLDVPGKEARDRWRTESYEVLMGGSYASRLPNTFFFDAPPEVPPAEVQLNEHYLLSLTKSKRKREAETVEQASPGEVTARATRRVRL